MDAHRFDRVTKRLARRRLSRRQALAQGGPALAAGVLGAAGLRLAAAEDASPTAEASGKAQKTTFMFVQSFRSGSIAAKPGDAGTYTLTLEGGGGQTIYSADRPSSDVGAVPTPPFLAGLGFSPDNPPNAALVVETPSGTTDIAVVELFNPVADADGSKVTYDVQVLNDWEDSLELGFSEAPTNPAALSTNFDAAHLFIDDCSDVDIACIHNGKTYGWFNNVGMCWHWAFLSCVPCEPWGHDDPPSGSQAIKEYWSSKCSDHFEECRSTMCDAWPLEELS
jgi:hypothetical protein